MAPTDSPDAGFPQTFNLLKKWNKKRTNPQNQKQKHSICEAHQKEGVPVNVSFLECPQI